MKACTKRIFIPNHYIIRRNSCPILIIALTRWSFEALMAVNRYWQNKNDDIVIKWLSKFFGWDRYFLHVVLSKVGRFSGAFNPLFTKILKLLANRWQWYAGWMRQRVIEENDSWIPFCGYKTWQFGDVVNRAKKWKQIPRKCIHVCILFRVIKSNSECVDVHPFMLGRMRGDPLQLIEQGNGVLLRVTMWRWSQ